MVLHHFAPPLNTNRSAKHPRTTERRIHAPSPALGGSKLLLMRISSNDPTSDDPRTEALFSAVVWRDCSLRTQMSPDTWKACRALMRREALEWRRAPILDQALPTIH